MSPLNCSTTSMTIAYYNFWGTPSNFTGRGNYPGGVS